MRLLLTAFFLTSLSTVTRAQQPPIGPDEALPHVRWNEADRVVGKLAVVSGKIERVGHARSISFLNFDPTRRDVFKLIVREAHRGNFAGPLESLYEGKIVRVRGRVTTYAGVPQIQVVSPNQMTILDELPPAGKPLQRPRVRPREHLTVATFNVRNLFDAEDDPYTSDEGTPTKPRDELEKVAATIREINADVLALQEVESRGYLQRCLDVFLSDMGYEHVVHFEGNDTRGIDACLVTRLKVGAVTSHRHLRFDDDAGKQRGFNRDLLRVELLSRGEPLEVWVVHLKSNSDGRKFAEPIRLGEARQIRRLLDRALDRDPAARIIVCGDFNDTAESATVREIVGSGNKALRSFWSDVNAADRVTYNLEPHRSMIDFLLCSPAMAADYIAGSYEIRSGALEDIGSDHNPVYAQFRRDKEAANESIAAAQSLQVVETNRVISVKHDKKVVVTYNKVSPPAPPGIDSVYERSGCLHPVSSPRGRTVTDMFPLDHPHQHGVFSAWVKTTYDGKPVDFWNLAGGTGRVLHERVVSTFQDRDSAGFEVDLIHRVETTPPLDVLRERWKITVYPTDGSYHVFDLETAQAVITDKPLIVNKHHYGGIALRGPTRWLTAKDGDAREQRGLAREPSQFLNDLGSNRVQGNHQHAKWVTLSGNIRGEPVSIAVLCHAENFRAPQAARLHPTKPYFCFAPCVDGTFTIDRDHPFKGRYRYLITDTEPHVEWIDRQWKAWCAK